MTARRQCKACPWRKDVQASRDIPGGYCAEKHRNLRRTVVSGLTCGPLRAMACHESGVGREFVCVGWLANQAGPGNNITVRLAMLRGDLPTDYHLVGDQHETLEDMLT